MRVGPAVAVLAVLAALAWPSARAQTIEDALAAAYRGNPQLLAERARLRATDEGVPKALSGWRPTVTLSGQAGKARDVLRQEDDIRGNTRAERLRTPQSLGVTVAQPLYRGGRTLAETSRAENLVLRGRAVLTAVEQVVLLDAATAFTNVLRDQAVVDLNINNEQVLTRQLEAAQDRFTVGEITRTDVAQAEARLARSRADRVQSEGNLISSRATYFKVIGEAPGKLAPATLPRNLPPSEAQALAGAANNPTVIAAGHAERAAIDDVNLIAGEALPTLSLNSSVARNDETSTRGFVRDSADIIAVLSVPLYQAGAVDARVRESRQTAGQRRIEVEDARRRAQEDAQRNWEALNTALARIVAFEAQIRAAEIALEGVQQEAQVGSRTVLDVLDAEQELLDAKVNLVRAQRDKIVAGYQLAATIGKLTAAEQGLSVEIYDPTIYYNRTRNRWGGMTVDDE
ncbi:MAG: TolC family outer membrane protein [Pseudomonadota bacterium]